jgi:dihydrofolate reductase
MAKLIMWNLITLDGYFQGEKNWDLTFHELVWGPEMEAFCLDQLADTSTLLFGRVTFEGMADYWKTAKGRIADYMNNLPKIVCSSTLETADWNNSTIIRKDVAGEVAKLKATTEKNIYVFGSAILSETLTRENLFDEYRIAIVPVLAGKGRRLFENGIIETTLSLMACRSVDKGGVILQYGSGR